MSVTWPRIPKNVRFGFGQPMVGDSRVEGSLREDVGQEERKDPAGCPSEEKMAFYILGSLFARQARPRRWRRSKPAGCTPPTLPGSIQGASWLRGSTLEKNWWPMSSPLKKNEGFDWVRYSRSAATNAGTASGLRWGQRDLGGRRYRSSLLPLEGTCPLSVVPERHLAPPLRGKRPGK